MCAHAFGTCIERSVMNQPSLNSGVHRWAEHQCIQDRVEPRLCVQKFASRSRRDGPNTRHREDLKKYLEADDRRREMTTTKQGEEDIYKKQMLKRAGPSAKQDTSTVMRRVPSPTNMPCIGRILESQQAWVSGCQRGVPLKLGANTNRQDKQRFRRKKLNFTMFSHSPQNESV
jgi:hypothetical protein